MSFTRPDGSIKKYFNGKSSDFKTDGTYDIIVPITMEDLQKAVLGDGTLTLNYVLTWKLTDNTSGVVGENSVEIKQNVIFKINANQIQIQDERADVETNGEIIWNADKAENYKLKNSLPATETEENKTTEENKKDDVPKTGEVI